MYAQIFLTNHYTIYAQLTNGIDVPSRSAKSDRSGDNGYSVADDVIEVIFSQSSC